MPGRGHKVSIDKVNTISIDNLLMHRVQALLMKLYFIPKTVEIIILR